MKSRQRGKRAQGRRRCGCDAAGAWRRLGRDDARDAGGRHPGGAATRDGGGGGRRAMALLMTRMGRGKGASHGGRLRDAVVQGAQGATTFWGGGVAQEKGRRWDFLALLVVHAAQEQAAGA
jgi:hypothetical protein